MSLAEKLRINNENARRTAEESAAREAVAKANQEAAELRLIESFFESARMRFTQLIERGHGDSALSIPVGLERYRDGDDEPAPQHQDVLRLLEKYPAPRGYRNHTPYAMSVHGKFGLLWAGFAAWANSEGLRAYWHEQPLGEDGLHCQLSLRVCVPRD